MTGHDPRNDQQLIAAINAGSHEAFESLYLRYRDWVIALALRFTNNRDDALDVMQETFSYVLRKFPGFQLTCQFKTFLYPAVKHIAIALRDKRKRESPHDAALLDQATWSPPAHEGLDDLAALLASLPDTHREVLLLRVVDGLSTEEVARAMGIPEGTVKSRLHHAIARLQADPAVRKYFQID